VYSFLVLRWLNFEKYNTPGLSGQVPEDGKEGHSDFVFPIQGKP
jgi:hypothetical protein